MSRPNDTRPGPLVISAAAGTGKTTRLVQEMLRLILAQGYAPSQVIAITFTRKAAAELTERVADTLRAALDPASVSERFRREYLDCYADRVPPKVDRATLEAALADLPKAPVGTTDSFVQMLLNEFALEAALPVGEGEAPAWLDLPLGLGDSHAVFEAAARLVLDPPDGAVPPEARRLLKHLPFSGVLEQVVALAGETELAPTLRVEELRRAFAPPAARALKKAYGDLAALAEGKDAVKDSKPYVEALRRWILGGADEANAPLEVAGWCAERVYAGAAAGKALMESFDDTPISLGVVEGAWLEWEGAFRKGRAKEADARAAEAIRNDLVVLANRVRAQARRDAASQGALDYGLLNEAAIALCEAPGRSEGLKTRFRALLVDEAQDASPQQARLYGALEALPGEGRTLETVYVGDGRQSIYLFRGAEPQGLKRVGDRAGASASLDTNYRSSPTLVGAQKALFAPFGEAEGVAPFEHVRAHQANARHEIGEGEGPSDPVVLVTEAVPEGEKPKWKGKEANDAGLDAFVERLHAVWAHGPDTAAVLAPSWPKARRACQRLQRLLGGRDRAFVDGGRDLAKRPVARDVRVLVRALWDRSDAIAWAALWKHPMVNVSDAGLARLRWPDAEQAASLAAWVQDALPLDALSAADQRALEQARPVLAQAQARIGREPTAEVLDRVAADLNWRAILAAGPDGDDGVAELEVILDWIRGAEADGVCPDAVLDLLDPDRADDPPRVEMARPEKAVRCMTVHQAKGLAFDHVYVYDVGAPPGGRDRDGWIRGAVDWEDQPRVLQGVCFDPTGGVTPSQDVMGSLAGAVAEARRSHEYLRLAYVAITRARRSVTMGLHADGKGMHGALFRTWFDRKEDARPLEGVFVDKRDKVKAIPAVEPAHARARRPFPVVRVEPVGWQIVPPSQAHEALPTEDRVALAEHISAAAEVRPGLPEPMALPADLVGASGEPVAFQADEWGTLVHAWFAKGGLLGTPDATVARSLFVGPWDLEPASRERVVAWLHDLGSCTRTHQPDLLAALRADGVRLLYEHPFVGVDERDPQRARLHAGRLDLLALWPDRRAWVIDFKAGTHSPCPDDKGQPKRDTLVADANLATHVPQIEAYRASLTRMGYTVEKAGLLFPRTGAWVGW